MANNSNKTPQTTSKKAQWTNPQVWDLSVGRTQGGQVLEETEGSVFQGDGFLFTGFEQGAS